MIGMNLWQLNPVSKVNMNQRWFDRENFLLKFYMDKFQKQ